MSNFGSTKKPIGFGKNRNLDKPPRQIIRFPGFENLSRDAKRRVNTFCDNLNDRESGHTLFSFHKNSHFLFDENICFEGHYTISNKLTKTVGLSLAVKPSYMLNSLYKPLHIGRCICGHEGESIVGTITSKWYNKMHDFSNLVFVNIDFNDTLKYGVIDLWVDNFNLPQREILEVLTTDENSWYTLCELRFEKVLNLHKILY